MNINDYVGKRCLLKLSIKYASPIDEYKILEISPSGNWIKVMNLYGHKFWKAITDISFVEELKDLKADKPT